MVGEALLRRSPFDLGASWNRVLEEELSKGYIVSLAAFLEEERRKGAVYPSRELVFNAFKHTPYDAVKVVIVGQDPYHGEGQAHGLSFSVPKGVAVPPSLQNIYKEIAEDIGCGRGSHGCLISWADRGVLLLNSVLTVRHKSPLSHQGIGWERFTDAALAALLRRDKPVVFMLWGSHARKKLMSIPVEGRNREHLILTASHPSPLSAYNGFLGCRHFSKANEALLRRGEEPIDWRV